MKKVIAIVLVLVFAASVFCSCKAKSPEIGKWRGTMNLPSSSSDDAMMEQMLLTGGNGIDLVVEFFDDNSFTMDFDTEKLKEAMKKGLGSGASIIGGLFGLGDMSGLVENMVDAAFNMSAQELGTAIRDEGTYRKEGDMLICNEDERIQFKLQGKKLLLLDEDGSTFLTLKKD